MKRELGHTSNHGWRLVTKQLNYILGVHLAKFLSSIFFIVLPAATLVLASPAAIGLTLGAFMQSGPLQQRLLVFLIVLPFYGGVLSAPGYIFYWWKRPFAAAPTPKTLTWIHLSLLFAFVCSLIGIGYGYWVIFFSPLSLICALCCGRLLFEFKREFRNARRQNPPL